MKITGNSEKDNTQSKVVIDNHSLGISGVHSTDQVYSQIKSLLDIPHDEPIFILRAQDKFALRIIRTYRNFVRDGVRDKPDNFNDWLMNMSEAIGAFVRWQKTHTVKVPD